jgi:hypothetical protein
MEKFMPSFEYELLLLSLEPKTSYEEKDRENTDGVRPLGTKTTKEELRDFRGGRDSPKREVTSKRFTS